MSSYRKLSDMGGISNSNKDQNKENVIVPEITTIEDKNALINNNKLVIVDVYANWCGPCQITAPLFEKLYLKYKDVSKLVKENVDLRLSLNTVQVVPTFQIFVDGKLKSQITGSDIDAVEDMIVKSL